MRYHWACPSGPPVPPPVSERYGPTRAGGPGRDDPRGNHSQGPPPGLRAPASPAGPDPAARTGVLPPVPVKSGAHPASHAHQLSDVRPAIGGLAERQPECVAGCFPHVRSWWRAGRPAIGRWRMRPVRPIDDAAEGLTEPGPVMGIARGGSSSGGLAGREAGACSFGAVVAWSHAASRTFAGHGSASRSICLPGWSSGERSARVGSGGLYVVSCSVAAR